jgi:Flp pilus assembly protein TadG
MCKRSREKGAVMVEFALVLPILLLLVFGMVWFGFAINYWIDETHLAREAARYAAVNFNPGPGGTLQASVLSQADTTDLREGGTRFMRNPGTVCIAFPANPINGSVGQVGDPVTATVTSQLKFIPLLGDKLGPPPGLDRVTITSSATMRLEAAPTTYTGGCG